MVWCIVTRKRPALFHERHFEDAICFLCVRWHLNQAQSAALIEEVVDKYEALSGMTPTRIVVHKTSMYQPEEEAGFRSIANTRVPACDLIWIRSTALRLIRKGMQEPWRGTLCR